MLAEVGKMVYTDVPCAIYKRQSPIHLFTDFTLQPREPVRLSPPFNFNTAMRTFSSAFAAFICCLNLFALSNKQSAFAAPAPALDIQGNKIRTRVKYFILPVIRGSGGGLTLASTGSINQTKLSCALDVVQEQLEVSNGLPLTFSPVKLRHGGIVRQSTDLNFKFSTTPAAATNCSRISKVWKLDSFDNSTGQYFITTGGVKGNPGPQTISNWFKIEKYDDDYKLIFCPTVCVYCKVICRDIGIYVQDGVRRLALSDVPFKVMFKRV